MSFEKVEETPDPYTRAVFVVGFGVDSALARTAGAIDLFPEAGFGCAVAVEDGSFGTLGMRAML